MKKLIGCIFAICSLVIIFSSCDDTESYADKLKKEKRNIRDFIAQNDIEVIDTYPENNKFEDNQFFYDNTEGIYIQVVDTGNGLRAKNTGALSKVSVRFSGARFLPDTTEYTNMGNAGAYSLVFLYGQPNTYMGSTSSSLDEYRFLSPALVAPLKYVGEEGVVRLIIPFSAGSYLQQYTSYEPVYINVVKYTSIQ